jgi:hypothetical protein
MADETLLSDSLTHAGGGTALAVTYLGVLIPGFLPVLVLTAAAGAVLIAPLLALGLAAAVVGGPPYGLWRLATRTRKRRRAEAPAVAQAPAIAQTPAVAGAPGIPPSPIPSPHVS